MTLPDQLSVAPVHLLRPPSLHRPSLSINAMLYNEETQQYIVLSLLAPNVVLKGNLQTTTNSGVSGGCERRLETNITLFDTRSRVSEPFRMSSVKRSKENRIVYRHG